jgi:hypothetical protein
MSATMIKPKQPTGPGWSRVQDATGAGASRASLSREIWIHPQSGLFAIADVEICAGESAGPSATYRLSVGITGARCGAAETLWALTEFGLLDAKEDDFCPQGKVRNFSLLVAAVGRVPETSSGGIDG